MDRARCEHIRAIARELIKKHKVSKPGTPIEKILGAEGLQIVFRPWGRGFAVGGLLYREERVVAINADDDPKRQRFSMAHEFGHYILGHDHLRHGVVVNIDNPPDDLLLPDGEAESEIEANNFANEILVPHPILISVRPKRPRGEKSQEDDQPLNRPFASLAEQRREAMPSPEDLANRFNVNRQVIYLAMQYHNLL